MTSRVPIRFSSRYGTRIPVVDLALKVRGKPGARLYERALLDTGSDITIFPKELLRRHRFPVSESKETTEGLYGLGGHARTRELSDAVVALMDGGGGFHPANMPFVAFVDSDVHPVLGRDVLEALNATLHIDFCTHDGYLEIG